MRFKYPRTFHVPWSPGKTDSSDKTLNDITHFKSRGIVVTEKMDGENTTIYHDGYCHARSIDSGSHPSRDIIKKIAGEIGHRIPTGWRLCGENLFAKHSIHYKELPAYFLIFNIWNDENTCLSWKETVKFCKFFNMKHVPVLFHGMWNRYELNKIEEVISTSNSEGYVIRYASHFKYENFTKSTAKWVKKDHVQCSEHWMHQPMIKNNLK